MKPVRTIEKLAYGAGTPDELADMVPSWRDLFPMGPRVLWGARPGSPNLGEVNGNSCVFAPDDITTRWFAACLIAHKAGCPPHWADMGFRTNCSGWWHHTDECDLVSVSYPGFTGDDWYVTIHEKSRKFTTELETRMHAYQLLEDGKR